MVLALPELASVMLDAAGEPQYAVADRPGNDAARNAVVLLLGQYLDVEGTHTLPLFEKLIPWKYVLAEPPVGVKDADITKAWSGNVVPLIGALVEPGIIGSTMMTLSVISGFTFSIEMHETAVRAARM